MVCDWNKCVEVTLRRNSYYFDIHLIMQVGGGVLFAMTKVTCLQWEVDFHLNEGPNFH